MRTRITLLVLALLAVLPTVVLSSVVLPSAAYADQTDQIGDGDPSGYTVQVAVHFSGDAAPGGGGTRMVRVAPACWWAPAQGPYTDAAAMLAWYDVVTKGVQTTGIIAQYGPRSVWKDAADAEADGQDLSWYKVFCKNPADYKNYDVGVVDGIDPVTGGPATWVTFLYRAFGVGAAIPPPMVAPAELARAAHDLMVIPEPATDHNPKVDAPGAPTLVGLPTWFWVTDADAVGGDTGTRTIRADLGNTWAQVVATTGGLTLSSPAGGTTCAPTRATTAYASGTPEASACTVEFDRASVAYPGGYPVTASTGWQAVWTGSGNTGGDLDPLARAVTTQVPVAEVQNVVTR